MRMLVYVASSLMLLMVGAASVEAKPPVVSTPVVGEFDTTKAVGPKFKMLPYRDNIVLLNSETGETWILSASRNKDVPVWKPIARTEAKSDAGLRVGQVINAGDMILRLDADQVIELGELEDLRLDKPFRVQSRVPTFLEGTLDLESQKQLFRKMMENEQTLRELISPEE